MSGTVPAQMNVVTLGARDFARLRAFYVGLGWSTAVDLDDFATFALQGALVSLFPLESLAADAQAPASAPAEGLRGFSLAIVVDTPEEVDAALAAAAEAGARISKPATDATEFEGRSGYFADPEDNYWEVVWVADGPITQAVRAATGRLAS